MNYNVLITSLLILGLNCIPALGCSQGNPKSTAYIKRDNNRCEGITPDKVSGTFSLVSLVIRNIASLGSTLNLTVHNNMKVNIQQVKVRVSHLSKGYLLDNFKVKPSSENEFDSIFTWFTYVLKTENIPVNELLALAYTPSYIYLPVTLGNSNNNYEFGFQSAARFKVKILEIRRNQRVVYRIEPNRLYQPKGFRKFKWNGKDLNGSYAASGLYELKVQAELEQRGQSPLPIQKNYKFEHNPNWLR